MNQQNINLTQEQILKMLDPIDLILSNPNMLNALKQYNTLMMGQQSGTGSPAATSLGGSDRNLGEGR